MHRPHTLFFALAAFGGLPTAVLAGPHPTILPPDSFINQHVASMSQMSQQVTLDPVVRRRLARHFHTSGPAVVRYIQSNLVLKKTTTVQRYQVYCVSRTGQEYTINSRLPIGTPVFVMRSTGKPVLKLACGNPMVASLPPVRTKIEPYTSPELARLPKPVSAAIPAKLASNGPVLVAMNSGPGVIIMPVTQKISPSGPVALLARSGRFPIGLLAGIPIIAGIATHSSNSSSGTTGTGTTGTGTTGTTGTGTTGTTGTGTTGTTGTGTTGTTGTGTTGTGTTGTGTDTGTTGTGTDTGTTGTGTGTGTTGTDTGTTGTGTDTGTTGTNTGTTGTGTDTGTTGTDTGTSTGTTGTDTGTTGTDTGTTGTDTGTTGTNTGTNTGTTPVPEPSTPAAFAVGAAGLAYLLYGARRRKIAKN